MHIKQLKKAYRERRLVPFVGAGLSVPLEMPGWGTLIDNVYNEFDYESLVDERDKLEKLIAEYRYLDAVDAMVNAGIIEDDLKLAICSAIYDKKKNDKEDHPDNIYEILAKMNCRMYLTTNYDNYLSDYVGKGPSDITHLFDEFINELHNPIYEAMVYNLHGDYTKPSSIILSRESYNKLYVGNEEFKKVLNYFREHYVLLFIGVSLDDEYIQEVLKVGSGKLRTRHYILLSDISNEKRKKLEEKYDVRIIKYRKENNNHTNGIRKVLNEIMHISQEEDGGNGLSPLQIDDYVPSMLGKEQERLPLLNKIHSEHLKDSKIYAEVQEIKKLQENGEIVEAIDRYNQIFQKSTFEPLSTEERTLIIKGLLYNYILIRDYSSAKSLIELTYKLPKSEENIDLLSYIVDYYFNLNDYESSHTICNEWYNLYPRNPLLYGLKVYTETASSHITYEKGMSKLITCEKEIAIETKVANEKQFIFRLAGELALHYKQYDEAVSLLRKAYEIDDNISNIEDLGIATYFGAIERADDGIKIKTNEINIGELRKAIEYFEIGFARAKGSLRMGVYSRVAILYLRSLFYLGRFMDFDNMYNQLVEFCTDDIDEIQRMKAISDIQLNRIDMDIVNKLNEIDKALVLTEYYNTQGMYEHALAEIKPIADKYAATNEALLLQLLNTIFNDGNKQQYNKYFMIYKTYWGTSDRFPIMESYYHEINKEYANTEEVLSSYIKESPTIINYSLLVSFYRRTGRLDYIGTVYEGILQEKPEIINLDPEGFYITYFEYLMETRNIEKAYWLFKHASGKIMGSYILKIMEIEIKVRLLDFNDVVENALDIYEKYQDYGETIFIYYASVAQLHYNNFEQSRQYLEAYKGKGHVDERSAQLVKRVEDKLNILQKRKKVVGANSTHHIKDIACRLISFSRMIQIPKNETVVIDSPALYTLFHLGKQNWLLDNPKVLVTFTTIEQLQNAFYFSGDELLLVILRFITLKENFKITSPSIESQIDNRQNNKPEFQDFYDSLSMTFETGYSFITGYNLPIGFQDGESIMLPGGFKTLKIVNDEIQIYTG